MHSTFLCKKHNLKERKNLEDFKFRENNLTEKKRKIEINSPLIQSPNIFPTEKKIEYDNSYFIKKYDDNNNKTLLQIFQNNYFNSDSLYPNSLEKTFSKIFNNYPLVNSDNQSPIFKLNSINEFEKEKYNLNLISDFDELNKNNISNHKKKEENINSINIKNNISKKQIKKRKNIQNSNHRKLKERLSIKKEKIIKEIKKEKSKEKIFEILKIYDKQEYEKGIEINKIKGSFPIEFQKQIFYKNILKIMSNYNLKETYKKEILKNKKNLVEQTNKLLNLNNINFHLIKQVLKKKKIRSRHHYIIYTSQAKKFCIDLIKKYKWNSEIISLICEVPSKNIKRWLKFGYIRKKGGGRKSKNPNLETNLINWINKSIINNFFPGSKDIRKKALEFSNDSNFQASKGWFEKFKKKYKFLSFCKKDIKLINEDNNNCIK